MIITIPFDNPAEYIYDGDKIEVTGGLAKLKNLQPAETTCGAALANNYNLSNWSAGTLTGTPGGTVTQEDGYVSLDSGSISYDGALNVNSRQSGAVRMQIRGQWPAGGSSRMQVFNLAGTAAQPAGICIDGLGRVRLYIGATGSNVLTEWPSYVPNTWYTLELNYDFNTGEHRLFIDGVKTGVTLNRTYTYTDPLGDFTLGADASGGELITADIKNVLVFDTPQHTTDDSFDPAYTVPETKYATDNPKIRGNVSVRTNELNDFVETSTNPGDSEVRYLLYAAGVAHWFDPGAGDFMPSDGSYAQSSTAAVIAVNLDELDPDGEVCGIEALLHSEDGIVTPELSQVEIDYVYSGEAPDDIRTVNVWGWTSDFEGVYSTNPVTVSLVREVVGYGTNSFIETEKKIYTPGTEDPNVGLLTMSLVTTDNMAKKSFYRIEFQSGAVFYFQVPDTDTANLYDLIYGGA